MKYPRMLLVASPNAKMRAPRGVATRTRIAAKSVRVNRIAAHPRAYCANVLLITRSVTTWDTSHPTHSHTNHGGSFRRSLAPPKATAASQPRAPH